MSGNSSNQKPLSPTELKRLHRDWRRRTDLRVSMILDGVQNPYNIGSILRSAAAYKLETIWLAPPTQPVTHAKVAKTALGCERLVETHETKDTPEALALAKAAGFTTVAIELTPSAVPLFDLELGAAVCLVMGHEERGVHKDTLAAVDHIGFLPQLGKVGSLNVAQAATAAIYETARQSWSA
ncbi:MAG: TrmH family RNA methyltransferase [Acidimicrobiales bacterium]